MKIPKSFILSISVALVCAVGAGTKATAQPARSTTTANQSTSSSYQNWYPSSITLPDGIQYHCRLRPLPAALPGIPEADRAYINHTYAMILKCTQAKTILYSKLQSPNARSSYSRYYSDSFSALERIRKEPTPAGLEGFRNRVVKAIILQMTFFDKATKAAEARKSFQEIIQITEGRQASGELMAAWSDMSRRYPQWGAETKDSIYHHLCALDLF
ncbi:MAG: hypothetical protein K2X93_06485 [Candidatus Obscuribacterales bacterium]|nr:hypothetical protein [Candidatus Obscuribacterales bacterium]